MAPATLKETRTNEPVEEEFLKEGERKMDSGMIWLVVFMLLMIAAGIGQFVMNLRKRRAKHGS
jgi:hypothetical protein